MTDTSYNPSLLRIAGVLSTTVLCSLAVVLMLVTVMACGKEDSAQLPAASTPSSAASSVVTAAPEPTTTSSLVTIDCSDPRLTKQILELSEENQSPFSVRVLKLYSEVEELERTERLLRCRGTASLSRGGESYITYHYEIDRDGDSFIGYEIGDAVSTPTPATAPSPGTTLDHPLSAGEALQGSNATEIRVLGVVEDARRQVAKENQFNDPPEEGKRFYMISIEVFYPLASGSLRVSESDFSLIGENRVVYEPFDYTCGVIPNELDGEIYAGGRIQGNICFEIPEDEGALVLIHEPGYGIESRRFLSLPPIPEAPPTQMPTAPPTAEATPTRTPTTASTPEPSPTQTATAAPTPEAPPTSPPTLTPRPEPTPTQAPTAPPTAEPTPTRTPTTASTPEPSPTQTATAAPTPEAPPTSPPTLTRRPEPTPTQAPTAPPTAEPTPTQVPTATPTPPPEISGRGTDVRYVDLPAGEWIVEMSVSDVGSREFIEILVGGDDVADVLAQGWHGRSLITVGDERSEIPPGETPIEVKVAQGASWALKFVDPSPTLDPSETISGQGQDVKFVELAAGEWVVEIAISGNSRCLGGSCSDASFDIDIGGDGVVLEWADTWNGRKLLGVGDAYGEIPPGRMSIEVEAESGATWTLRFIRQ